MPYDHTYNNWKLFLDDVREVTDVYPDAKPHEYKLARSTEEAKSLVEQLGIPVFVSLDHDLGGNDTSMDFLKWLAYDFPLDHEYDVPEYKVHSANPVGSENIVAFMNSWEESHYANTVIYDELVDSWES